MLRTLSNVAHRYWLLLATMLLSACGGSQQSLPSAPAGGSSSKGAAFARVTFLIKIPRTATSSSVRRRPLFVSPSITSVTVSVSATGSPTASVTSNVVCTTAIPAVCTVTANILAPVQNQDTFTVVAFDGANGAGRILSRGSVVYPVPAGQVVQIPIVLEGTVASVVAVNVKNANPTTGSSATSSVFVTAADADGNVIVGQYATPLPLQLYENDSEGLFSFAQGGPLVTTGTVAGSATPATLYLKAKTDTTTPDDATIVATLPNAPFVPGTSPNPPLTSLGEITTSCATTSAVCVYYPSGYQILATTVIAQTGSPTTGTINSWDSMSVIPANAADPGGAKAIWNVPPDLDIINRFDPATGAFSTVSTTAPQSDTTTDIAGSFWGPAQASSAAFLGTVHFATNGTSLDAYPFTGTAFVSTAIAVGSAIDTNGQLWALDNYMSATNTVTGAITQCSFESTDVNFASPNITALAVAGSTIWIGVSGAADGNTYVFKVPAAITATGCDLTTIEKPATQFKLTPLLGQLDVDQISVDAAANAYVVQYSAITKIAPGGLLTKLVDAGLTPTQSFDDFTLDPSGTFLYLTDTTNGTLDRASATTPSAIPLPSVALPPVFGILTFALDNGIFGQYQPFFTPDGALWLGACPFDNPAQPFSLLGTGTGYQLGGLGVAGGLAQIKLANATFAVRATAAPKNLDRILQKLHAHGAMRRSRIRR